MAGRRGRVGGGGGPHEQLAALVDDAFGGTGVDTSRDSGDEDGGGEDGAGDGYGAVDHVFRFNVIRLSPPDAHACALWAGFSGRLQLDLLPAADEFIAPPLESGGAFEEPQPAIATASATATATSADAAPTPPAALTADDLAARRRAMAEAARRRAQVNNT